MLTSRREKYLCSRRGTASACWTQGMQLPSPFRGWGQKHADVVGALLTSPRRAHRRGHSNASSGPRPNIKDIYNNPNLGSQITHTQPYCSLLQPRKVPYLMEDSPHLSDLIVLVLTGLCYLPFAVLQFSHRRRQHEGTRFLRGQIFSLLLGAGFIIFTLLGAIFTTCALTVPNHQRGLLIALRVNALMMAWYLEVGALL